jgi:hypothetical protein
MLTNKKLPGNLVQKTLLQNEGRGYPAPKALCLVRRVSATQSSTRCCNLPSLLGISMMSVMGITLPVYLMRALCQTHAIAYRFS